ncbi:hypothetical protein [Streptomyces hygroscopicus]|uniref:hypothetical protein n=1 Tax=Streptomyces hygroscopicus TaxID=1912 RepID=UPI00367A0F1E
MTTVPGPHDDRPLRPVGLLEKLMAATRPEFRQEDLAFDPRHGRWAARGHPEVEEFAASYEEIGPGGSELIDLRQLSIQLRLEVRYALQCRHDEATKKIRPAWAQRLVNALADAQVRSLLDEPEEFWKTFRGPTGNWATGWGTFLLGARQRVEELVHGRGWEAEYPRTVWRLRNLGIVHLHTSTITFEKITQPWLRDLAKRWARWRLSGGINAHTVRAGVRRRRPARGHLTFLALLPA